MNKEEAIRFLGHTALQDFDTKPMPKQIEILQALSIALPTDGERTDANRIAFSISETQQMLLKFCHDLRFPVGSSSTEDITIGSNGKKK